MASAFSPNKNFELQATGENQGTWGTKNNANFTLLDTILGGGLAVPVAGTNIVLTAAQTANLYYRLTGTQSANIDLTFGTTTAGGYYIVDNSTTSATAYTVTLKAFGAGRSFVAPRGQKTVVFSDGTNVDPIQTLPALWCGATGGSTTAYTVTAPGNITALLTGLCVHVQWNATNTAAATLNLSTLGAKSIYKPGTAGPVTVLAGELPIGGSSILIYDASLNAGAGAWVALTGIPQVPLTRAIAAGTGLSGGGDLSADRTINLANTAVGAASYGSASQVATFTVDAQGRLTAAANAAINVLTLLGYTPVNKAGDTMTGALIVQSTGLTPGGFTTTSTSTAKSPVDLYRNKATPVDLDQLVSIAFTGNSSTGVKRTYAEIVPIIVDEGNASEDGRLAFRTIVGGAEADRYLIGEGLYSSTATGTDKGVGTINLANGYWRNNALLPRQVRTVAAPQTIGNNVLRTAAHGLGAVPTDWGAYMVCTFGDLGYAVGQRIKLDTHSSGGTDYGIVIGADTTNVFAKFPTNGLILANGAGGGNGAPNAGFWELYFWWETS
jgi:hypothetical protein